MKKIVIGIIVLILLYSCGNKKSKIDPFQPLTNMVDSAIGRDSVVGITRDEVIIPLQADDSFNDFIYSFAIDQEMQHQRIVFPLPFYTNNNASKIEKKNWKKDDLFAKLDFYTLLFDKEEDMELVNDTALNSVQFEWIYLKTRMVKKYYFERIKGAWMLEAINLHAIESGENEAFIDFYTKFANDTVFQQERVRKPLGFITTDPDDDFSVLETTLDLNQWLAFMPMLPKDKLSNIRYGQITTDDSSSKILALKGIGNGFSNILYFEKNETGWELYKFEDLSN